VLAFGDSITHGGGELQWGVALQSWALWMARGLGLPYSGYAVDGARVGDVLRDQLPAFKRHAVGAQSVYDVSCLYIGVNDVRHLDWDAGLFAAEHHAALAQLLGRARRTLAVTAPLQLGLPRARAKVRELNCVIEANARDLGVLIVDLSDFRARNHLMADRVHPTALGQVAIAERALAVLQRDGMPVRVSPRGLIRFETTWPGRLRGDATYVYRSVKALGRAVRSRRENPPGGGPTPR
jgi:lysophospholipase L1-like esterase